MVEIKDIESYDYIINYLKSNDEYTIKNDDTVFLDKEKIEKLSENFDKGFIDFLLKDEKCKATLFHKLIFNPVSQSVSQ
jgi:hypothetical protein